MDPINTRFCTLFGQWIRQICLAIGLCLTASIALASDDSAFETLDRLIDGLHEDAHQGEFDRYFDRYTPNAVFMGTDKSERWTINAFKAYAAPAFADGHGWSYTVIERNWEGEGSTRWFDEILLNAKLGHCRGTGVVRMVEGNWKIAHYSLTLLIPNDIAEEVGTQSKNADH